MESTLDISIFCATMMESALSIYAKTKFRRTYEKQVGRIAKAEGDSAGGAGGGSPSFAPDDRLAGKRAIQPVHTAGVQDRPLL